MPKKVPIEEQYGAYEDLPELEKPKKPKFGMSGAKQKYEKVSDKPTVEAVEPAPADVGYPRRVSNTNPGTFATNYVSTTKYSRFTFLPMATLQQYKRGANVYLLFIAVLCCIPAISPLMPLAAVMPVVFVLTISLVREGMEDYARYQSDESMNNKVRSSAWMKNTDRRAANAGAWLQPLFLRPTPALASAPQRSLSYSPIPPYHSHPSFPSHCAVCQMCLVRNPASGKFEDLMWKNLKVGDMIKIMDKDWIPADVLMLTSSAEDGAGFIDTMDLDGETNLKRRSSPKATAGTSEEDAGKLTTADLKCAGPSGDLYRFDGALKVGPGTVAAVSESNLLLRSSRLRNTKWAIGIVVYTGQESKVMLNSRSGGSKQSALEAIVNTSILVIFMIQLGMAVLSAMLSGIWAATNCPSHAYLGCNANGGTVGSLTFWTYIILLNSLIPASLIVTMEIVKVVHASFINWDHVLVKSFDKKEAKWRRAEARTSALNEGLGQIDYIFSDKTGTLTENKMELMYTSVDGTIYGASKGWGDSFDAVGDKKLTLSKASGGAGALQAAADPDSSGWKFLRMLAVCQTVLIEKEDDGSISYNADSPDEVALVLGGKGYGVEYTGKTGGDVWDIDVYPSGKPGVGKKVKEQWRVLSIIPFSSKRKRMSVVVQRVQPPPDSTANVEIWMKGADNVILDRVSKSTAGSAVQKLLDMNNKHLVHFSMEGLRTLCFATKSMPAAKHAAWARQWEEATLLPPEQREGRFEELASQVEDEGFALCGATAVEDKLQDNVPETIVRLARAQIKLWVLTGDKQETAIEIGRSTNLLTPSMKMHILNCTSEYEVNMKLDKCLADAIFGGDKKHAPKQGLVVDGATLNYILEGDANGTLICKPAADKFVALATQCRSVVVCRSSPLQKALIVLLVRKYVPGCRSLSVGDGANDVPMIRAASIGIGIAGLEGMQAARASDYSVQQFQDLDRLLLHHGRLSYFRISNMCTYFFYKSWAFTLPQWLFGFYCGYSGLSFYEALYVPSFNMFFTSMPVFARACLDTDLDPAKAGPLLPELYHVSKDDKLFNTRVLSVDLLLSFVHAAACFFGPQLIFSGDDGDLWQMSLGTYSLVVFVCTVRIMAHTRAFSGLTWFAYTASVLVYLSWEFFYDRAGSAAIRGAAPALNFENAKFKYTAVLFCGATFVSEMAMRWCTDNLLPTNVDIVRCAKAELIKEEGDRREKEASAAQKGEVAPGDDETDPLTG